MSKIEAAENALKAKLDALQDPQWDSSDSDGEDDDDNDAKQKQLFQDILSATKESKSKTNSSKREQQQQHHAPNSIRNAVLYIGHLPRHLEEAELTAFLKQFGGIVNLKVVRSKKTGRSRGYAFVQMKSPDVAAIVADTLSGYIIMGQKRLVCHLIPADKVHAGIFAQTMILSSRANRERNKPPQSKSLRKLKQITSRLVKRERKKREALKEMGIDYEFPGYEESNQKMEETKSNNSLQEKETEKKPKNSVTLVTKTQSDTSTSKKKKQKDATTSIPGNASGSSKSPVLSKKETKKKRKDLVTSVTSTQSDTSSSKKTKQKDSTTSITGSASESLKTSSKKKNSKDSLVAATVGSNEVADVSAKGDSKKKRKDSIASVDSAQSEGSKSKKHRKNSKEFSLEEPTHHSSTNSAKKSKDSKKSKKRRSV